MNIDSKLEQMPLWPIWLTILTIIYCLPDWKEGYLDSISHNSAMQLILNWTELQKQPNGNSLLVVEMPANNHEHDIEWGRMLMEGLGSVLMVKYARSTWNAWEVLLALDDAIFSMISTNSARTPTRSRFAGRT